MLTHSRSSNRAVTWTTEGDSVSETVCHRHKISEAQHCPRHCVSQIRHEDRHSDSLWCIPTANLVAARMSTSPRPHSDLPPSAVFRAFCRRGTTNLTASRPQFQYSPSEKNTGFPQKWARKTRSDMSGSEMLCARILSMIGTATTHTQNHSRSNDACVQACVCL